MRRTRTGKNGIGQWEGREKIVVGRVVKEDETWWEESRWERANWWRELCGRNQSEWGRGRVLEVLRKKEEVVREGKTQREETRMMTADWRRVGERMVRRN